jgi:hypothetical protein
MISDFAEHLPLISLHIFYDPAEQSQPQFPQPQHFGN